MNRIPRLDSGRWAALEAMNVSRSEAARDEIRRNRRVSGWRRRVSRGA